MGDADTDRSSNVLYLDLAITSRRPRITKDAVEMTAETILAQKRSPVITVKPSDTVGLVARQLKKNRFGVLVVSQDGLAIDGIISERDIAYALADRRGDLHLLSVSALMTREVVTCQRSTPIAEIAQLMTKHRIRHIPVVETRRLVGVISMRDVLELRLASIERRNRSLMSFLFD